MRILLFATLFSGLIASLSFSADEISIPTVEIKDRIETQNFMKLRYPIVFGKKNYCPSVKEKKMMQTQAGLDALEAMKDEEKEFAVQKYFIKKIKSSPIHTEKRVKKLISGLDNILPEKILRPLVYWKLIKPKPQNVIKVLEYYMLYKLLILRDHIDNPLSTNIESAQSLLNKLCQTPVTTQNIFMKCNENIKKNARMIAPTRSSGFIRGLLKDPIISTNLKKKIPTISDYSLSYLGFIPGNVVELIRDNDRSEERMIALNKLSIFNGGKIDFTADYMDINKHMIFKDEEGDAIYKRIREMIHRAEHSIFIDIFLYGGTLGITLSKYLLDECKKKMSKNPDFKLFMLHDYATNYNMVDEMLPIFTYIIKRLKKEDEFKGKAFLLQSNIHRHPPGVPFELTNAFINSIKTLTGEKFKLAFEELEKRNTYLESKIDHSKVIVIDANSKRPEAYFGSKNWTDHSGGYYYDDAIYVKGPAAALVQAAYYDDMKAALTEDIEEQKWFYYKDRDGIHYDNLKYLPERVSILNAFKVTHSSYPMIGKQIDGKINYQKVRIAEANVDGTIKDVRNMIIDMIMKAESHIYMEHLFIYDPYINDALIKRKLERPDLKVRILSDNNENFGLGGLPNSIFKKELRSYGIELKSRKLKTVHHTFINGEERDYHQELHRKTMSVDGKVLLGGSSNLNPDTLQGSFREFGAQIFDKEAINKFESEFIDSWNDPKQVEEVNIDTFQVKFKGQYLDHDLSEIINDLGATIFRNKDNIENRY